MEWRTVLGLSILSVTVASCEKEEPPHHHHHETETPAAPTGVQVDSAKVALYAVLPATADVKTNPSTPEKIALGQMLFSDARLSKSQDISCNTCHVLGKYGMDGKDFSTGFAGAKLDRNTPTLYDSAFAFVQFWDGAAETTEDAIAGVLKKPPVMGAPSDKTITDTFTSMPAYVDAFKKAFPDDANAVSAKNTTLALAVFTRQLVTPSKWDKFVAGDATALTDPEKQGFLKFVDTGCPTCHVGPLVGGTMYQKLGKEKPWPNQKDKGRSGVTKSGSDDMMFRVASLRNIEHTGPYFHDASAKALDEAVKDMATYQLAKTLSDDDAKSIVTWLDTLSAEVSPALSKAPTLPPSTAKTPKRVLK
jgi:cytochrome c peroxidase